MGLLLSERELAELEPAEMAAFHSPVPTQIVSNGEFVPLPQTSQQRKVEARIKELADAAASRLGMDRRQFLRRAIEYVETHLAEPLRSYHLAKIAGLSKAHFVRTFKTATGVTSHRFVMNRRLNRAVELLSASDESLSHIAIICGFSDQSHFCRVFRRALGVSPGTWRRSCMRSDGMRSAIILPAELRTSGDNFSHSGPLRR